MRTYQPEVVTGTVIVVVVAFFMCFRKAFNTRNLDFASDVVESITPNSCYWPLLASLIAVGAMLVSMPNSPTQLCWCA